MRRVYILLIVLAVLVFLAISTLLARIWSADGAERSAITGLVQAEARGDQNGMLSRMLGCSASSSCRAQIGQDAAALRHAGKISILQLESSAGFSLMGTLGAARVAWNVASSLPIVQCVRVRRAGDALHGLRIELLAITPRLKSDASCPAGF